MRQSLLTRLALHAANLLVIAFLVLPLAAATIGALQSAKSLQASTRSVLPPEWTLDNFRVILSGGAQKGAIFEQATYLPDNVKKIHYALANSVLIATTVTLLTLAFGSLSAYTVARLRLRWVNWLMNLNLIARFVPVIVVMIPLYVTFRQLGLLNSIWGVIIALTGFLLPYGVVILAPYFAAVPRELEEAARIDGCSRFGAFLRVTLPLSAPALASYGAIVFIVAWNDLLIPLILNNRAEFIDPAGRDRQPGKRPLRLPQPDDGDLPDRAGAVRDPGIAAATLRGRGPLCRRNQGLRHSIVSTV